MHIDSENSTQKIYSVSQIFEKPNLYPNLDLTKFVVKIERINQDFNTPSHDFDLNEYKEFKSKFDAFKYFKHLHTFEMLYVLTF